MIVFENAGEIDPQLVMLVGVNVKEGASPIGFFGTGLKYAVACITRWGEQLTIQSGESEFSFRSERISIRGKEFEIIRMLGRMDSNQLGFTTELGKQWKPWMVYRELWSNCQDELGPGVYETVECPRPQGGLTRVIVSGERMQQAHLERDGFILSPQLVPLERTPGLDIYLGQAKQIFYRGIAVQGLEKPSLFTYNILSSLSLTEDRTASVWQTDYAIAQGLAECSNREIIDATLIATSEEMESRIDYCYPGNRKSIWRERAEILTSVSPLEVPRSVREKFVPPDEARVCPTCKRAL